MASPAAADPYQWLEGQHDPSAVAWAKERRDRSLASLEASPAFSSVDRELKEHLKANAPLPMVFLLGPRLIRFIRDVAHPSGLLQAAPATSPGVRKWRTLLDLASLNKAEGSAYDLSGLSFSGFPNRCLPPAFDRCLLAFSPKGSSNLELREFDLATGTFVKDGFRVPANRSFTTWLNADTLLIAHSLDGSPALPSNFPAIVRLWRRGTPLSEARPIFQAAKTDSLVDCRGIGSGPERRGVLSVAHDYSTIEFKLVDQSGAISPIELPQKVKYVGNVPLSYPYMAVQLAEAAVISGRPYPAESIVSYDVRASTPQGKRYQTVFAPEPGSFVNDGYTGFEATRSGFVFIEAENLRKTLVTARQGANGWSAAKTLSAPPGVNLAIISTDGVGDRFLVRQEGFLKPPEVSLVSAHSPPSKILAGKAILDADAYVVEIKSARSKDGEMVDYYLVRPKKKASGPTPTLMGGYGSFGLNYDPSYFSSELKLGVASWLQRGGALVATAIRGGGERGEAWHLGGAGVNKQRSFDDFIAVAEDLTRTKFTSTAKLGAFGRSAGGTLAAVMATERPDLFGAILAGVPVTDLIRMSAMSTGIVAGQKAEFGDWDDPKVLPLILAYSPYQNIRSGVKYPPVLIITSTEDNQVGPGQARKFAARLEEVGAKPLLLEEATGGHGVPDQIKQPELVAAEMTFFIDALMTSRP